MVPPSSSLNSRCLQFVQVAGAPEKASQATRKPAAVAPALAPRPHSRLRASTRRYMGNKYTLEAHWTLCSWAKMTTGVIEHV